MSEFIKSVQDIHVPTTLIIGGLFFLFIGIGGIITGKIITSGIKPAHALIVGILLLLLGGGLAIPVIPPVEALHTETAIPDTMVPASIATGTTPSTSGQIITQLSTPISLLLTTSISPSTPVVTPFPMNVLLTKEAWDYLNNEQYLEAIAKAQECIDQIY